MHDMSKNIKRCLTAAVALTAVLSVSGTAVATPPPWAPAHGYRAKAHHHHRHSDKAVEAVYVVPFGISEGTCHRHTFDRRTAGALLGGVTGGLIGAHIGKGDGRVVATIGGALIGVLVGSSVGASMDVGDGYCFANTLEYAETDTAVHWRNPDTGVTYQVEPTRTYSIDDGRYCREYQTTATIGGEYSSLHGTACRQPDGTWQLVN